MPTYLLTWNPTRFEWDYDESRRNTDRTLSFRWSTGNNRRIAPGDRVFLFRQHSGRGIFASGYSTSGVYRGDHWSDNASTETAAFADIDWDLLLPLADVLPIERLEAKHPEIRWMRLHGSGIQIPPDSAQRLERLWRGHVASLGLQLTLRVDGATDESPDPTSFREGACRQVWVNAYERNPEARRRCIEEFGYDCSVCGFNFAKVFGELGHAYIHVHHLTDQAVIGGEHDTNPLEDLRPVCPNCHAMLHQERPAMSVEKLRSILRRQRALPM